MSAAPYRVYLLDASNHIEGVEIILAASDVEAGELAREVLRRSGRHSAEVWDCGRKVALIEKCPH